MKRLAILGLALVLTANTANAGLFGGCGRGGLFGRNRQGAGSCGGGAAAFQQTASFSYTYAQGGVYQAPAPVTYVPATYYYAAPQAACGAGAYQTSSSVTYLPATQTSSYTYTTAASPPVPSKVMPSAQQPDTSDDAPNDRRTDAPWLKAPAASAPTPPPAPTPDVAPTAPANAPAPADDRPF